MFGNGVVIGSVVIHHHHRQIPQDHPQVLTALIVVVVGTAMRGTVVFLIAATVPLLIRATLLVSALSVSLSLIGNLFIFKLIICVKNINSIKRVDKKTQMKIFNLICR